MEKRNGDGVFPSIIAPSAGSGVELRPKSKMIFVHFICEKPSLVTRMLLNAMSLSYLNDVKNEYRRKYHTFTCPVLSEIVNWTLYQKTDGLVKCRTPGNASRRPPELVACACHAMLQFRGCSTSCRVAYLLTSYLSAANHSAHSSCS